MTPRMRITHRLKRLIDEVTGLRAKIVEQEIYSTAKDDAMREYVNDKIAKWNTAIRATNGPKRGELGTAYRARVEIVKERL